MGNDEEWNPGWTVRAKVVPGTPYSPLVTTAVGQIRTPSRLTVIVDAHGRPDIERITFEVALVGRRYHVQRLEAVALPGGGIELSDLGRLPLSRFFEHAIASKFELVTPDGETYSAEQPVPEPIDPLHQVAITYSAAVAVGRPPTQAVAEDLGITANAAAQRVRRAREAGYLPPTTPGKVS